MKLKDAIAVVDTGRLILYVTRDYHCFYLHVKNKDTEQVFNKLVYWEIIKFGVPECQNMAIESMNLFATVLKTQES